MEEGRSTSATEPSASRSGTGATRPAAGRLVFRDVEHYANESPPPHFEMTVTGPEQGPCTMDYVRFDRGSLTLGEEGGPNVGHTRVPSFAAVFLLPLSGPSPICNGRILTRSRLALLGPDSDQIEAVRGPSRWARFAAAPETLREVSASLGVPGPPFEPGRVHVTRMPKAGAAAVRRLLADAADALRDAPGTFDDPGVRARTFRRLAEAFLRAAGGPRVPAANPSAAEEHERILVACMAHLEANVGDVVTVEGLCTAAATSQRTLTRVFRASFDLSPARYLRLRRLNQVRSCLSRAIPRPATVTEAAARYGFSQLGRFAGDYRRLFRELPSETLERRGRV